MFRRKTAYEFTRRLQFRRVLFRSNSHRHLCYMVEDLEEAERVMREAGAEIIPDDRPFDQWRRFYTRDPGGNFIEVGQLIRAEERRVGIGSEDGVWRWRAKQRS